MDAARLIDERPMSGLQVTVAVLCALAMFLDGYDIQVMALSVPSLAHEWARPPSDFGLALSAAPIGIALGGAFLGHLGDRFGRRSATIGALILIGLSTAGASLSTSPGWFVAWRLLTGVGIGACVPNCNAWTAEYAPARLRSLVVVAMNAAIGLGAFSAGFLAPPLIHALGWRGIFLVGGGAPLAVALLLFAAAPESLKFLLSRRPGDPRIAKVTARIAPDIDASMLEVPVTAGLARGGALQLLGADLRARTILIWTMVALNLFTLYVLISWLPTLLEKSGWSPDHALQGAVMIQLGGVAGGLGLSLLLDGGLTKPALVASWIVTAIALLLFLVAPSQFLVWSVLLIVVGAGISGSQLCLNALSAAYYPTAIKATGVAWVGVIGGIGSIIAPLAGAWLIARGMAPTHILAMLTVPALLCAAAVLLTRKEWQTN